MHSLYALAFLLCSGSLLNRAIGAVYYVATTSADPGCRSPCLTLSQFQSNMGSYLGADTELIFLAGTHQLSSSLSIANVHNFSMMFQRSSSSATARVTCLNYNSINFRNSQHIYIVGIEFIGCGSTSNQIEYVSNFVLRDSKFQGQGNSGTALELTETTAQIFNCRFLSNKRGKYIQFWETLNQVYGRVGGAILASNSSVNISQSHFEGNVAEYGGAMYVERSSVVHIKNSLFIRNNGTRYGGGVAYSYISSIMIESSTLLYNTASSGGIVKSWYCNITIINSYFDNSTSTGTTGGVASLHGSNMIIKSSNFTNTYADFSGGVIYSTRNNITMESSRFENNSGLAGGVLISFSRSIIMVKSCKFYRNTASPSNGGAMDNHESEVTIIASEFVNNYTPESGGALYSRGGTNLTVERSRFSNNVASNGGAMFSTSSNITILACSFVSNMVSGLGTGLYSAVSTVTIRETSAFVATSPDYRVGILYSYGGTIIIEEPVTTTEQEPSTTEPMTEEPTTVVMTVETDESRTTLAATRREIFPSTSSITMGMDEIATTTIAEDVTNNTTITSGAGNFLQIITHCHCYPIHCTMQLMAQCVWLIIAVIDHACLMQLSAIIYTEP